ncbi:MAG: hypothetical protein ABIH67_03620 [Candidatus Uhrbacteria bacterium]
MATQSVRDENKRILEQARQSLARELAQAKEIYGQNVEQLAHPGEEAPYVKALKEHQTRIFSSIIHDALITKGCLEPTDDEWKIAIMGNHGDIVISIISHTVRFQYFGDTEFVKLPRLQRNYPFATSVSTVPWTISTAGTIPGPNTNPAHLSWFFL